MKLARLQLQGNRPLGNTRLSTTLAAVPFGARLAQAALDLDAVTEKYFGNEAPWYRNRIPLFGSSDAEITDVYYYRWNVFHTPQRDIGSKYGFISTEFIDNVGWQTQPWASNNCAAIFHLSEGRWCRDPRFKQDYATFMYSPDSNPRQFSESMADGVWRNYLVDGNPELAFSLLDDMQRVYKLWVGEHYDESKGFFWVEPIADADYNVDRLHDVFDGRVWFWTQDRIANGLDTPQGSDAEEWVSIELGAAVGVSRADIAFFGSEEKGFDVPASYRVQVLDGEWTNVADATYDEPVANGITSVKWTGVSMESFRILIKPQSGKQVRLVEWKVFSE